MVMSIHSTAQDGEAVFAAGIDHKVVMLRATPGGIGPQAAPGRVRRARRRLTPPFDVC